MHLYCTSTTQRAPGVPGLPEAARYLTGDGQRAPASGCLTNGGMLPNSKNVRLLGSPSRHGDHLSASPYPLLTDLLRSNPLKEDVSPLLQEDDQEIFRRSGHCFRGNTPSNAEWWTLSARHTILTTREFPSPPHLRDNDNPARWEL